MMDRQTVWVDVMLCSGCGECVAMCPEGAITMVDGKARIGEETCTGCGACADACPENAIQPVIHADLVPAPQWPPSRVYHTRPLVQTAGSAVTVAGAGLLMRVASALARAVGQWLTQRVAAIRPSAVDGAGGRGGESGGRRKRRRRRGR